MYLRKLEVKVRAMGRMRKTIKRKRRRKRRRRRVLKKIKETVV